MDKRGRITIWDILIWLGIALIIGWALFKSLGIINSPVWVEMIPFYGIGVSAIGVAYKIGRIMKGIEFTSRKVGRLAKMEERFNDVEKTHKLCIEGRLSGSPYRKRK